MFAAIDVLLVLRRALPRCRGLFVSSVQSVLSVYKEKDSEKK
jgi:hypothetical protein